MTTETETNQTEPDIIVEPADNELDTQAQETEGRYRDPESGRFAKKPEGEAPRLERNPDPRERIAEAFAKARKEAEGEQGEIEQMPVPKRMWSGQTEEEANEEAGIGQEEAEQVVQETAKEPEEKPTGPTPMTIVVDGQMFQVDRNDARWSLPGMSEDMARANAQMFWATQARLNAANQYLDKSKGTEPKPSDQYGQAPTTQTPEADGHSETKLDPDKIGDIVDKLQLGNRDEAVEALQGLIQSIGGPRQAPDIAQTVQAALVERENQNEIDRAISAFEKENADIANDKYLAQVVLDIAVDTMKEDMKRLGVTDELLAPNGRPLAPRMVAQIYRNMRVGGLPVQTHAEVLSNAVGKLRTTFNLPRAPKPNPADQVTAQSRLDQKRQLQTQPRSAGVKNAQGQPRPQTSTEVVRDMKRQRMPWLG